ncbi:hypothetical protein BHE74_00050308 [Ensete ventricosum]|nr:hypothetical protein GW17_00011321 [Ensete ventricosum]RWW43974.1 hypothetical protein BHE74_00050308 [Ensete ventricosum]
MDTIRSDLPSSPVAEVADNFEMEVDPCAASSIEDEDGSDTESGFYSSMRVRDPQSNDDDEEACSNAVDRDGDDDVDKAGVYVTWVSSPPEEKVEEHGGGKRGERRLVNDTREEDRAFWEACLAHGYP